jgi:hypothetical protein
MPSLYDELELVQSRSSADDDGPQLLDDNVMSYADLDLVEDDDEEDETVEDPHTLVELMEPANEGKEVDDSKENLPKTRPLSFFTTLRSTSPKKESQGRNQ